MRYDTDVITFSHMLPRKELLRPDTADKINVQRERMLRGVPTNCAKSLKNGKKKSSPTFNFTKYAGCTRIEDQIRTIGSVVHVYGHQHRNRDRIIEGVHYVSHCIGSVKEQQDGWVYGLTAWKGPKLIWPASE